MTPWLDEAQHLLRLAERDHATFRILFESGRAPLAPTCFHAQQAIEKALKAVLTLHRCDYPRTHDLAELASLVADRGVALPIAPRELLRLNPFGVEGRYDEQLSTSVTPEEADGLAAAVLHWARTLVLAT